MQQLSTATTPGQNALIAFANAANAELALQTNAIALSRQQLSVANTQRDSAVEGRLKSLEQALLEAQELQFRLKNSLLHAQNQLREQDITFAGEKTAHENLKATLQDSITRLTAELAAQQQKNLTLNKTLSDLQAEIRKYRGY